MNFYTDVIMKSPHFHSPAIYKGFDLLEPEFRAKVEKFQAFAKEKGHVVEVVETYRSPARQRQLYAEGWTQLKNIGVHGYGLAVDFSLYINGKYDPRGADYTAFVALAKEAGILSGIDWGTPCEHHSFHDYDHLQGIPVFRQNQLFAGVWYPGPGYDPWEDQKAHGINVTEVA